MKKQVFITNSSKFGAIDPVKNNYERPKPCGGLWTSTFNPLVGSEWIDFVLGNDLDVPENGIFQGFILSHNESARIKELKTHQDIIELYKRYGLDQSTLDFEEISKDFDAIHLTGECQEEIKYKLPTLDWDVECTLWFRYVFTKIEPFKFESE